MASVTLNQKFMGAFTFNKRTSIFLLIGLLVLLYLILRPKLEDQNAVVRSTEPVFRRHLNRVSTASPREFCLVSYNILVDPRFDGTYLPLSKLENSKQIEGKDSKRHRQMMKEIKWLNADVINLQEVEEFYWPILVEEFGTLGFKGVYDQHRKDMNGVATFYNEKKFKMKKTITYYFNDLLDKFCNNSQLKIPKEGHGAQRIIKFTLLENYETGKQLVLANTHILFGEWRFIDMHALQIALFLQQLYEFLSSLEGGKNTPWVLSGDFNMYPHFPVYELVTTGKVSEEGLEKLKPQKYKYPQIYKKDPAEDGESLVLKYCKNKLSHPLQDLKSAYKTILGKEPPLSHYQINKDFPELYGLDILKGTLDYIFYSSNTLKVNAVLEPVNEEVIKPLIACPNKYFSSDHLSIKACFNML